MNNYLDELYNKHKSDVKVMFKNMLIKVGHKLFEYFKEKS